MLDFRLEEKSVWSELTECTEPVIMYGTGNGADKVLDILDEYGVKISGVTASDGFVRKRQFRGFNVTPLSEFEKLYKSFTVIVTFGTQIPDVIGNIKKTAERHRLLIPCVPVCGTEYYSEAFIEKNAERINRAYSLMADEKSRRVFEAVINFEFSGKPEYLFSCESSEDEAFENCIKLTDSEIYADIGAYRGDTVEKFLKITGGRYKKIIAAEPDAKSFKKLCENCGSLVNFEAVNKVVAGFDGFIPFSSLAGRQSAAGTGPQKECVSLRSLCGKEKPTYIKIDAEGCEYDILNGGREIIKECMPKLNIAAYHRSADIFELALLINEICPEYKIHLRHHPYIPAWDTNLYCKY